MKTIEYKTTRKFKLTKRLNEIRKFRTIYKNYTSLVTKRDKFKATLVNFIEENKGKRRDNHYVDKCIKALQMVIDNYQKEIKAVVKAGDKYPNFYTTNILETDIQMYQRLDKEEKDIIKELNDKKPNTIENIISDVETFLQGQNKKITSYGIRNIPHDEKGTKIEGETLSELIEPITEMISKQKRLGIQINVENDFITSVTGERITPHPYYLLSISLDDELYSTHEFNLMNCTIDLNLFRTIELSSGGNMFSECKTVSANTIGNIIKEAIKNDI